jgi:hypothetical protein
MSRGQRAQLCIGMALAGSLWLQAVLAAPDRLDNKLPDAFPDTPGDFAMSLGHEWLDLDGALGSTSTNHDYFKLRYQFNPDLAGSIGYAHHQLGGAEGLLSPLFDNRDSATIWSFDLSMNLLDTPETAANADAKQEYVGASAFNIGVAADIYDTSTGAVSDSTTLLKAYLAYSTDLTTDIRAHTYFSSGRLSGGGRSGSVNTVAAGLDYDLAKGSHPLTLMANGILDIYNFRDPAFDTSRVSRFDLGLRYRFTPGWYGQVGWMTVNDSASDASGSGLFANVNWTGEGDDDDCVDCVPCEPAKPSEPTPAPVAAMPTEEQVATAPDSASEENRIVASRSEPPLMDSPPALDYPGADIEAGLRGTESLMASNASENGNEPPLALYTGPQENAPENVPAHPEPAPQERVVSETSEAQPAAPPVIVAKAEEPTPEPPRHNEALTESIAPAKQIAPQSEPTPPVETPAAEPKPETTSIEHYPVLLEPGHNVELVPLDRETVDKVQQARASVDRPRIGASAEDDDTTTGQSKEVLEAASVDEASRRSTFSARTVDTVRPDEPVEDEPLRVASRSRFDFPAEAILSEAEEQSAIKPASADVTAQPAASSDKSTVTSKPVAATEVAKPEPNPAQEPIEHEQLLARASEHKPEPARSAKAPSDESSVEIAVPDGGWSESKPGDGPTADPAKERSVSIIGSLPASANGARTETFESAVEISPEPVKSQSSESSNKPRHVPPGSRMLRPPVSEAARQGLAMLMSFMLPATQSKDSSDTSDPETPAGGEKPADISQPATDNKIQLTPAAPKSEEE